MAPILPPDHKPLASPFDELFVNPVNPMITLLILMAILDLCPRATPVADPPFEEQPDVSQVGRQAMTYYTSGRDEAHIPMPLNQFDWPVPGRRPGLHPSQIMSATSSALLFGDTPSTTQDSPGVFSAKNA